MMNGINYFISYWVPRWINTKMEHFNVKLGNEGPMTFMSKILGKNKPINMTMTKYPQFRSSDQMIELHLDGRYPQRHLATPRDHIKAARAVLPPRVNGKQFTFLNQ